MCSLECLARLAIGLSLGDGLACVLASCLIVAAWGLPGLPGPACQAGTAGRCTLHTARQHQRLPNISNIRKGSSIIHFHFHFHFHLFASNNSKHDCMKAFFTLLLYDFYSQHLFVLTRLPHYISIAIFNTVTVLFRCLTRPSFVLRACVFLRNLM